MNPLTLPWKLIAEIVAAAALFAAVTFGIHQFLEHEREIGRNEIRTQVANERNEKLEAALAQSALYKKQLDEANDHAKLREKAFLASAAAAGSASNSLRDELAEIRRGVPGSTVEALRKTADTLADVLGQCQARYREVARAADGHASDVQTLEDAFPE